VTPAYAVQVRHSADHAQQQATEQAPKDPADMAREILRVLPDVVAVLPADEVYRHLSQIKSFWCKVCTSEVVCVFC
jgi:chorismate mutase